MKFCLAFIFFISLRSQAEYRVFVLQITNAEGTSTRQVLSNLDPDQYPGYYPLKAGETIVYTDTWMCKERTSERPFCANPRADPQTPAAQTPPATVPDSP